MLRRHELSLAGFHYRPGRKGPRPLLPRETEPLLREDELLERPTLRLLVLLGREETEDERVEDARVEEDGVLRETLRDEEGRDDLAAALRELLLLALRLTIGRDVVRAWVLRLDDERARTRLVFPEELLRPLTESVLERVDEETERVGTRWRSESWL